MTQTNKKTLEEQVSELTTKFNQLIQILDELRLKKPVDFTELEIDEDYDDEDDEIINDDDNLIND